MAIAKGVQGQNLPKGIAAFLKEIDEMEGIVAKIADAMFRRKGADGHQNPGFSFVKFHRVTSPTS